MRLSRPGAAILLLCFLAGCGDEGDDGGRSSGGGLESNGGARGGQGEVLASLPEWAATPDPLAAPGELPDPGVFPCQLPFLASATFPRNSTRFVAVSSRIPGKRNREEVSVIDLQSGAKVFRLPEVEMSRLDRVVLSDDGEMLAIGGSSREASIRIWSTKTGELIEERPLTEDYGTVHLGPPSWFEILPGGELVAKRSVAEAVIYAWRPGESDEPRGFKVFRHRQKSIFRGDAVAVSPGGKYLAALMGNVLVAHDLATGQCVGAVEFPEAAFPLNYHCDSLHFSSDGRELAAVSVPQGQSNGDGNILCWDWTTGHLRSRMAISAETVADSRSSSFGSAFPRPWLQWLPDRSGWVVFGRLKCPQRLTGTFATLPVDADCPTRIIDESRFIFCRDDRQARKTELVFEGAPVESERTGLAMEAARGADPAWTSAVDPSANLRTYPRATAFPLLIPKDVALHYSSLPDDRVTLIGEVEGEHGRQSQLRFVDLSSGELVGQRKCDLLLAGRFVFSNDGLQAYILRGLSSFSVINTVGEAWRGTEFSGARSYAGSSQWMGIVAEKVGLGLYVGSAQADVHLTWLPGHEGPDNFSLANVALGSLPIEGAYGLSHGGRYFAAIVGRQLVVHDIESGECVGASRLPDGLILDSFRCAGLFFAPDGKEIVALLSSHGDQPDRLLGWDAESGELSQDWFVARKDWEQEHGGVDLLAYEGRAVEWLPDGSGWLLYGHMVFPREASAETLGFPPSGDMSPRRLVDADTLVVRTSLTEDVAALTLLDRGRGELMPVTKENAKLVGDTRWPEEPGRSWEVELDGVEFVASVAKRELVIPNGMSHQMRFSSTPSRYAAIGTFHQSTGDTNQILVLDTATGTVTDTMNLPERTKLHVFDVSPDGKHVLTFTGGLKERLIQVWDVKAERVIFQSKQEGNAGFCELRLLQNDGLLVAISNPPQIRVANFLTSKILAEFHPNSDRSLPHMKVAVSPGGRNVAVIADHTLSVYDLHKGDWVGEQALPDRSRGTYRVAHAVFQLDGSRLYAIGGASREEARLIVWDVVRGEILQDKTLDAATVAAVGVAGTRWQQPGWVPNEAPYLFAGNCVIDGATGRSIGLGLDSGQRAALVLGRGEVLMSQQGKLRSEGGLPSTKCVIAPVHLSLKSGEQLAAAVERNPQQRPEEPAPSSADVVSDWNLEVDPAPSGAWEPARRLQIPIPRRANPWIGNLPSPFVCLFDAREAQFALCDMRSGKVQGNVSAGTKSFDHLAIRPDGQFVVFAGRLSAYVVNMETGQPKSIELEHQNVVFASFAADGNVVLLTESGSQTSLLRCDPATGARLTSVQLPGPDFAGNINDAGFGKTISPGGRYLAVQAADDIYVYEIGSGQLAARAVCPYPAGERFLLRSHGLAFSLDGTRLATIYSHYSTGGNLAMWDVASGRLLNHRHYQTNLAAWYRPGDRAGVLQWLTDGQGLLLNGMLLFDGQTGAPVWGLDDSNPATLVGLSRQARLVEEKRGNGVVSVQPIPNGAFQASEAARRSRCERLPELTVPKTGTAVSVSTKEAQSPWQPATVADPGGHSGGLTVVSTPPEKLPTFRILPQVKRAIVQRTRSVATSRREVGPLPTEMASVLETYDLSSGKLLGKIEVPGRFVLLDVSADGALYLTGEQVRPKRARYARLDVWNSKDGNHLLGWRPLPTTTPFDAIVSRARFSGKRTLFVEQEGRVASWMIPECRLNYELSRQIEVAVESGRQHFLVGDRAFLTGTGHYYPVREIRSGGTAQKLHVPERYAAMQATAMTFSPDGRRVVGLLSSNHGGFRWAVVWDIESGKMVKDVAVPLAHVGQIVALDGGHVLALASPLRSERLHYLVDLDQERISVAFEGSLDEAYLEPHGDQLWRVEGDRLRSRSLLASARNQGGGWRIAPMVAPGMPVMFEFKTSLRGYDKFREQAEGVIKELGWKTGGGGTRVEFNVTESTKTGAWDNENNRRLDRRVRRYQFRVVAPDGAELWEQHSDVTMDGTLVVGSGRAGKIKAIGDDSELFETWLQRLKIPPVLFREDWAVQIPQVPLP